MRLSCFLLFIVLLPNYLQAQSSSVLPPAFQANLQIASASVKGDQLLIVRAEDRVIARKVRGTEPEGFIEVVESKPLEMNMDRDGNAVVRYDIDVEVPVTTQVKDEKTGKMVTKTTYRSEKRSISRRVRNVDGKQVVLYKDWVEVRQVTQSDGRGGIVNFRIKYAQRDLIKTIEKDEELIRCRVSTRDQKKLDDVEFFTLAGKLIEESEIRKRLLENRPVVLLTKKQKKLDPFYKQLLNPKTILIYSK